VSGVMLSGVLALDCGVARAQIDDALALQIEAVSRLKDTDLDTNPALKGAVLKILDRARGQPEFVQLVRDFKLKDRSADLLAYATSHPAEAAGVDAVRWLLESGDTVTLESGMKQPRAAEALLAVLANATDRRAVPFLLKALSSEGRSGADRKQAVRGLARTQEGAEALVEAARSGKLPQDVTLLATSELQQVRWPAVRAAAAQVLPPLQTGSSEALPPLAELIKRPGDAGRGGQVFHRETVGCLGCHQIQGEGVDFGPNLSEIGSKLGKDALLESILDPSAGISFGYEAWEVDLNNDEELFGLIVSETADEISLKAQTGIVRRVRKAVVRKRTQQKLSIMPTGLQQTMSVQDLVDLVEYLTHLKKPEN